MLHSGGGAYRALNRSWARAMIYIDFTSDPLISVKPVWVLWALDVRGLRGLVDEQGSSIRMGYVYRLCLTPMWSSDVVLR